MIKTHLLLSAALLCGAIFTAPAHADPKPRCAVGDICELTFPLFGCKDEVPLRRWVELYVDATPEKAEAYITEQEEAGQCMRFYKGDKLRIVRYIGLSRLEAMQPNGEQRWLMLLK
ncbi:hypothetical protein CCR94_11405 [Rhodoblastus sphagnicola]|uniref:Uncharacterized protein n=1 Tax=Rhodoblastus sphagnicola TaxID=333368 RepID=A0A2S6N7U3_9HYPH|nr:hypothetical protein [Rhodoblastus sphagnicola]MBB4197871.1 hypothetical protein [Rhodoblastus sphagnicola]PPQ30671.1 hypothetical protein CCR94_11405 [Rhodoblastus sphagnicola]